KATHDRKPEPEALGALAPVVDLVELIEDTAELALFDAHAGVAHLDVQALPVGHADDADGALIRVADRIRYQIAEQPAQELGIGVYGFAAGRDREYQPTLRGLRLEVETQPLEDVVERMHADLGRD